MSMDFLLRIEYMCFCATWSVKDRKNNNKKEEETGGDGNRHSKND